MRVRRPTGWPGRSRRSIRYVLNLSSYLTGTVATPAAAWKLPRSTAFCTIAYVASKRQVPLRRRFGLDQAVTDCCAGRSVSRGRSFPNTGKTIWRRWPCLRVRGLPAALLWIWDTLAASGAGPGFIGRFFGHRRGSKSVSVKSSPLGILLFRQLRRHGRLFF